MGLPDAQGRELPTASRIADVKERYWTFSEGQGTEEGTLKRERERAEEIFSSSS